MSDMRALVIRSAALLCAVSLSGCLYVGAVAGAALFGLQAGGGGGGGGGSGPVVSATASTVTASPGAITASGGVDTTTITVTVRSAGGTALRNQSVVVSVSGTSNFVSPAGSQTTDASGVVTFTLASSKAEVKTVTATVNPGVAQVVLSQQPTVTCNPGAAAQLTFSVQPTDTRSGSVIIPDIEVAAVDAYGNAAAGFTGNVTLALSGGTAGAVLSGTNPVAAAAGVAVFDTISVDKPGTGYTLTASAATVTDGTSAAFDILLDVVSARTADTDSDGLVDAFRVTWSAPVTDATYSGTAAGATDPTGTFLLGGDLSFPAGDVSNDATTYVRIVETGEPNTDGLGQYQTSLAGVIQSADGVAAESVVATAATDGAAPALLWARYADLNNDGAKNDGDAVELLFSENVTLPGGAGAVTPATEIPLQVTNDSWGTSTVLGVSGNVLQVQLAGGQITIPGQFDSGATTQGAYSGLNIAFGANEVEDAAGNDAVTSGPVDIGIGFRAASTTTLAADSTGLAVGSVSGDGDLDALVVQSAGALALAGLNTGSFTPGTTQGPAATTRVLLAHLDGDAALDGVFAAGGTTVDVREGDTTSADTVQFLPTLLDTFLPAGTVQRIEAADLSGAARQDLILGHPSPTPDQVWVNDGAGNFVAGPTLDTLDTRVTASGDLDGDGVADIVCANFGSGNRVFFGDGAGGFTDSGQSLTDAGRDNTVDVVLLDAEADGDLDIVFTSQGGSRLWVNDGTGFFTASQRLGRATSPTDILTIDFDLDGDQDLIEARPSGGGGCQFWVNLRNGTFRNVRHPDPFASADTQAIAAGDTDSDGDQDLISSQGSTRQVGVQHSDARSCLWTERFPATRPSPRSEFGMAYDSVRGVAVLFGGDIGATSDETWEWNGLTWAGPILPATRPSARKWHAMAYDSRRGVVVLFGGNVGGDELWEWDGASWSGPFQPASRPSARQRHAMAFDSRRGVVVLFGGSSGGDETWEWNGTSWRGPLLPTTRPSSRADAALAFDRRRGVTVLFGGTSGAGETWEWDGTAWTQRTPVQSPPARSAHAMSYDDDRGVVVLFGGGGGPAQDTWEWDGTNWTQRTPPSSPPARRYHAMVYDERRGVHVVFGGSTATAKDDTWEYSGPPLDLPPPARPTWVDRAPASAPSARAGAGMAYDGARGETVLFGGDDGAPRGDTWTWTGTGWTPETPATNPPARYAPLAYDAGRGVTVMFGGYDGGPRGDTYEWNGVDWTPRVVPSPPARWAHGIAYDEARRVTVVFGGQNGVPPYLDDTWEWDGSTWTEKLPGTRPDRRDQTAMAYDARRGVVVLFGGRRADLSLLGDTWEWDGSAWNPRTPPVSPSPRQAHQLVYDRARGVVVLAGGTDDGVTTVFDDTWEWDGVTWTRRTAPLQLDPRYYCAASYDAFRQQVVVFGGFASGGSTRLPDTWEYHGTRLPASPEILDDFDRPDSTTVAAGWTEVTGDWQIAGLDARAYGHNGAGAGGAAMQDPYMTRWFGHRATFDIQVRFRVDNTVVRPTLYANAIGWPSGLGVVVRPATGQVEVLREGLILGSGAAAIAANTEYNLRLAFDGATLSAKVWRVGTAEPASFTISAATTDVPVTQNRIAIGATIAGSTTRTVWFDDLRLRR